MSPDEGMLFVFDSPREIAMWMKNTLISLDMIFVNAAGKIIRVAQDTTPMSEDTIPSGGPSKAGSRAQRGHGSENWRPGRGPGIFAYDRTVDRP